MSDAHNLAEAAQGGLCTNCRWAEEVVSSKGSAFIRCKHAAMPKYPPQPVLLCRYQSPREA